MPFPDHEKSPVVITHTIAIEVDPACNVNNVEVRVLQIG